MISEALLLILILLCIAFNGLPTTAQAKWFGNAVFLIVGIILLVLDFSGRHFLAMR